MLVKQHTKEDWAIKGSKLYLQASHQRGNPAGRFYSKLGFQRYDYDNNGKKGSPILSRSQFINIPGFG
jgi:hypothetical protein